MFVSDNSVKSAKAYFFNRLETQFSERELRMMFNLSLQKRLNLSASDILLSDSIRLSESDLLFFRAIVKQLQEGMPFQHIHGEVEFYDLTLKIDHRALIPRPETEELVHWIATDYKSLATEINVLDVCTGSGCIALALKSQLKHAKVVGVDVSKDALDLASENKLFNELDVTFLENDMLTDELPFTSESLDVIVSNPPYIMDKEKVDMRNHVLDFEPHLALFVADETPFIFYDKIAEMGQSKLRKGGSLYFEINEYFGPQMVELMEKHGYSAVELRKDLQGKDRMIKGVK